MRIAFKSCGKNLVGVLVEGNKEKPAVILCHGLSSNKDRPHYEEIAKELEDQDVASLRFDFYGHGESEGEFSKFNFEIGKQNILDAIHALTQKGYTKFIVSGSSFMGVCTIMAAAECKDIIALALLSPGSGSKDYGFVYELAEQLTQSTYVIHGDTDPVVPVENSKRLAEKMPSCTLEIIKGADHTFTNMKQIRTKKILEFIKEFI